MCRRLSASLATLADDRFAAMGGSFDYMMQTGYLFGGWQLLAVRSSRQSWRRRETEFSSASAKSTRLFFMRTGCYPEHALMRARSLHQGIVSQHFLWTGFN